MTDDDYIVVIDRLEISQIVFSLISLVASLSVVFILLYRYEILYNNKLFSHAILMIALSDSCTSLAFSFGYPKPGVLCSIQGFTLIFFARSSWFWTCILTLQLFGICLYRRMLLTITQSHIITLSINVLLQSLPFTTQTYYGSTDDSEKQVCTFSQGKGTMRMTLIWVDNLVHLELIICFVILFLLTAVIIFHDRCLRSSSSLNMPFVQSIQKKGWTIMLMYPLAMFASWLPGIIFAWYVSEYQKTYVDPPVRSTQISSLLTIFNTLYGLFLSIIFYSQTSEARKCWMEIFNQFIHCNFDTNKTPKFSIDMSENSSIDFSDSNLLN